MVSLVPRMRKIERATVHNIIGPYTIIVYCFPSPTMSLLDIIPAMMSAREAFVETERSKS